MNKENPETLLWRLVYSLWNDRWQVLYDSGNNVLHTVGSQLVEECVYNRLAVLLECFTGYSKFCETGCEGSILFPSNKLKPDWRPLLRWNIFPLFNINIYIYLASIITNRSVTLLHVCCIWTTARFTSKSCIRVWTRKNSTVKFFYTWWIVNVSTRISENFAIFTEKHLCWNLLI